MKNKIPKSIEEIYKSIWQETLNAGFTMFSDIDVCSILKTLATSKPHSKFLELGTGTGLATAYLLDGMNANSTLTSIDNDKNVIAIATKYLGKDPRLTLVCIDGEAWIKQNLTQKFDFIFADTWHGKYLMLEEVLNMLNPGGIYFIDDMLPQDNWPEGHTDKVKNLIETLENHEHLHITKLDWGSGLVIGVKK